MKKLYMSLFTILIFQASSVFAQQTSLQQSTRYDPQDKNIGLGVLIGEPTGFTGKVNFGPTFAFDVGVAWAFAGQNAFHIHGDFLNHARELFRINGEPFDLHYGAGVRVKFNENNDDNFGIRIPVGIDYMFASIPVETFFEIAPIVDVTPDTDLSLNISIGARYFF